MKSEKTASKTSAHPANRCCIFRLRLFEFYFGPKRKVKNGRSKNYGKENARTNVSGKF